MEKQDYRSCFEGDFPCAPDASADNTMGRNKNEKVCSIALCAPAGCNLLDPYPCLQRWGGGKALSGGNSKWDITPTSDVYLEGYLRPGDFGCYSRYPDDFTSDLRARILVIDNGDGPFIYINLEILINYIGAWVEEVSFSRAELHVTRKWQSGEFVTEGIDQLSPVVHGVKFTPIAD